ncbi:MAG: hypothetical protein AB2417_02715 [Clostridiaceae bacterium]
MVKEKESIKYWVIKIGNLFYVSGLPRKSEDNKDTKGYDFSNNENVAFPILIEDDAKDMAKEMGGIVVEKSVCNVEELIKIKDKVNYYINSAKLIEKQNYDIFRELQSEYRKSLS